MKCFWELRRDEIMKKTSWNSLILQYFGKLYRILRNKNPAREECCCYSLSPEEYQNKHDERIFFIPHRRQNIYAKGKFFSVRNKVLKAQGRKILLGSRKIWFCMTREKENGEVKTCWIECEKLSSICRENWKKSENLGKFLTVKI